MAMQRLFQIFTILIFASICKRGQCFIGNNIFKTRSPILFERFCVENGNDLESIGETTITHESITIEGIKNSVISLFRDKLISFETDCDLAQQKFRHTKEMFSHYCLLVNKMVRFLFNIDIFT